MRKLLVVLIVLAAEGFTDPSVQMKGFPFLTQLAARDFSRATVSGERLEADEGLARDVDAELTDVRVPSTGPVGIASLSARGTVPYDVVAQARVQARGSRLRLVPTGLELEGGGTLDDQLSALLADRVAITYPIPDLPDGVQVDQITAGPDGFAVEVSGRDVSVNRP